MHGVASRQHLSANMNAVEAPRLSGSRVVLRAPSESDRVARQVHGFHAEIERNYGHLAETRLMTDAEADEWWSHRMATLEDPARCEWMIDVEGHLAGVTFLHSIDRDDRNARLAIGLYDPGLLGLGIGTEAIRLVLDYAFGPLDLHRVELRVLAFNTRAIAAYQRCGFIEEGRLRENALVDGEWHDDIIMSILEPEFASRSKR